MIKAIYLFNKQREIISKLRKKAVKYITKNQSRTESIEINGGDQKEEVEEAKWRTKE